MMQGQIKFTGEDVGPVLVHDQGSGLFRELLSHFLGCLVHRML